MTKLSPTEIEDRMKKAPEWTVVGDTISRTFQFKDFAAAMLFVNKAAQHAEKVQHHPDILIRWNRVTLTLSTHDAGGVTEKDFAFAGFADGLNP
jgi:4a-hydroxytetrahydrobiopterin dehydratase